MCGRFALTATPEEVRRLFDHLDRPDFPPRDEIAPTEPIAVVRLREGERRFDLVRWGFVPAWAKDPGAFTLVINARAETAVEKPSFRNAMRHGRCLVPATAWWEWGETASGRRAHRIAPPGGGLFAFAGLVETWAGADGSEIDTAAILTVASAGELVRVHDRMPAILAPTDFDRWLDTVRVGPKEAVSMLKPAPEGFVAIPTPTAAEWRRAAAAKPSPSRAPRPDRRDAASGTGSTPPRQFDLFGKDDLA
jgi:putative SOS response-associated peptidase YedK